MHNFIQRLTLKQREELIELIRQKIIQVIGKQGVEQGDFCLDENLDWLEGEYLIWEEGSYDCAFVTFGVDLTFYPYNKKAEISHKSPNFEVKKAFIKYMYTVFGEEYKTAYMEHVSKLYFE